MRYTPRLPRALIALLCLSFLASAALADSASTGAMTLAASHTSHASKSSPSSHHPKATPKPSPTKTPSPAPTGAAPSPSPTARPTPTPANPSADNAIVLAVLNDIDAHGWNPVTDGLFINWMDNNPALTNLPSSGPTGHDMLTDLRDLVNMDVYESTHPGDTSQTAAIARLQPTVEREYKGYASDKGWVYYQLLQLGTLTGNPFWASEAEYFAAHYAKGIDPATGIAHGPITASTGTPAATCSDGYRVDHAVEASVVLIDAGKRFATPAWTVAGNRELAAVTAQAFSPKYHLFARAMCLGAVWDPGVKAGEAADEILVMLRAGVYTGDTTVLATAESMLDSLVAGPLHDTVNGGYFDELNLATGAVNTTYKEARQLTLLTDFHLANAVFGNRYAAAESEMLTVTEKMFHTGPTSVGYLYRTTVTFGVKTSNGVAEHWVTTESDGIALEALQSVL